MEIQQVRAQGINTAETGIPKMTQDLASRVRESSRGSTITKGGSIERNTTPLCDRSNPGALTQPEGQSLSHFGYKPTESPTRSPAPQTRDQLQPHPLAKKSSCCISSCAQRIWGCITTFFRWVFCVSKTQKPSETPPSRQTQTEKKAETLATLDIHSALQVDSFFGCYADNDIRFGAARSFFMFACPERIQTWILFALVTKKNPIQHEQPELQNLVAKCRKDSSDSNEDIDVIERYLNYSKPSIRALMKEFEVEGISALDKRPCKWIKIKQTDLPKIEAILEENLRSLIAKECGQPAPLEPVAKRGPPSAIAVEGAEHFINGYRDNYTSEGAIRLFEEYTSNEYPESERIQELILEKLLEQREFKAMNTLIWELSSNRMDAFYEKLYVSPDEDLAEASYPIMKAIFQEGLGPTTPLTT